MDLLIDIFAKIVMTCYSLYIPNGSIAKRALMYEIKFPKWFEYIFIGTPFDAPINSAISPLLIALQTRLILYIIYICIMKNPFCFNIGVNVIGFMFWIEMLLIIIYMIKYSIPDKRTYYLDKKLK